MSEEFKLISQRKCLNCHNLFYHELDYYDYYCPGCKAIYNSKKKRMRIDEKCLSLEYQKKQNEFIKHYYATTNYDFTRKDLVITKVNR